MSHESWLYCDGPDAKSDITEYCSPHPPISVSGKRKYIYRSDDSAGLDFHSHTREQEEVVDLNT